MKLPSSRLGLALLLALAVSQTTPAQTAPARANTSNLFLGLDGNAAWLTPGRDLSWWRFPQGVRIGYGFVTAAFALFFEVAATQINEVGVGHGDFGARWHFSSGWLPTSISIGASRRHSVAGGALALWVRFPSALSWRTTIC